MVSTQADIGNLFLKTQLAWLAHPRECLEAQQEFLMSMGALNFTALAYLAGGYPHPCVHAVEADNRFSDSEWASNPADHLCLQHYITWARWLERLAYDTPGLTKKEQRNAAFWVRQWLNAFAPSNFFLTNPIARQKAEQTTGASLARGIENFYADLSARDLQETPAGAFTVGKDLACTPGAVVFRNELMEVIQYRPLRDAVHAVPVVIVPSWTYKYYLFDLDEKTSMVRHLLSQGLSVFTISWKNPDASMAGASYESYLRDGIATAIDVARGICRAPQVHAAGYGLGGTALATLMAWFNRKYGGRQVPVAHWTLLAALVDFSQPGEIAAFVNEHSLPAIDALLERQGYLDKGQLDWSLRMLRPNTLIWHYFVHKYLYGETPSPSNIRYWHADGMRVPAALHRFCLHRLYVENRLAEKDGIAIDGCPIDMSRVHQPLYAVGAAEDHVTPWRSVFAIAPLVRSPIRFVLAAGGHVLGIIPAPDASADQYHRVGDAGFAIDGEAWCAQHARQPGSWWADWTAWLRRRCGPMQAPPPVGAPPYSRLADAPGSYVLEQ
ncbi:MAG TPA: hypothetical protein VHK70_06600 [Burkholderiaceae bacterium]|jgi:polyhydroxyalkanoate synthase|nr:hypothetical protein [Burkholderiaceae bacterium]